MNKTYLFILVILCCLRSLFAQHQTIPVSTARQYFSVEVTGMKSEQQARHLESEMLKDVRFFSCKLDFSNRTISLITEKGVTIEDVKQYTSRYNLVISKY